MGGHFTLSSLKMANLTPDMRGSTRRDDNVQIVVR